MKMHFARAALLCLAFVLPVTAAMAGEPIPGVDVMLGKNPAPPKISATTDADGQITLKGLEPGDYELVIDGKTLDAALDKLAPQAGTGGTTIRAQIKFEGTTEVESPLNGFAVETCACHTGQPTRVGFTLPQSGTVKLRLEYGDPRNIGIAVGSHF